MAQPIKDILLSLVWWYPDEYALLQILAGGDRQFVQDYLRHQPESTLQFARYGLLSVSTGEFAIADIREFLNSHGEAYKREISPFTRTDMPPELLPEVPDLELLAQLSQKRIELEAMMRRVVLMYLGVKHSWAPEKIAAAMIKGMGRRSDRKHPAELFTGRTPQQVVNDLYTLDLKFIVSSNWEVFSSLFDANKARFEMNMDTLNKARRIEGHTRPITVEEAAEFENSYAWLRTRLIRVPQAGV